MTPFGASGTRGRSTNLAFLLLAYPIVFLQFQGGEFCRPLCFEQTMSGVTVVLGMLVFLTLVASWLTTRFGVESGESGGDTDRFVARWLTVPSPLASAILLSVFVVFLGLLVLDALIIAEPVWKPIAFPLSFFVFLPVWVLYVASFPIAIVFSLLGIDSPEVFTLLLRAIVVFVGFPLSVLLQARVLSALTGRWRS